MTWAWCVRLISDGCCSQGSPSICIGAESNSFIFTWQTEVHKHNPGNAQTVDNTVSHLSSLTHTMRFAKTNLNISGLSVFAQLNPGNSTQLNSNKQSVKIYNISKNEVLWVFNTEILTMFLINHSILKSPASVLCESLNRHRRPQASDRRCLEHVGSLCGRYQDSTAAHRLPSMECSVSQPTLSEGCF